jgi:hypothetical protein
MKSIRVVTAICLSLSTSFFASPRHSASAHGYSAAWQSTVDYRQLGKGDLNQAYNELLDYLMPRQLASEARGKCYLVVRYLPVKGQQHQLNLIFDHSRVQSSWLFELPDGLPLVDAEDAPRIAADLPVIARQVTPTPRLNDLLAQHMKSGFVFNLKAGSVLHGDEYRVWASCDLSSFEGEITVPENESNEMTQWLQELWKNAFSHVDEAGADHAPVLH